MAKKKYATKVESVEQPAFVDGLAGSGNIQAVSKFLGVSPDQVVGAVLQKAKAGEPVAGLAGDNRQPIPPTRSFMDPVDQLFSDARGVREQLKPFSFNVLRQIERKDPIISGAINHRARQVKQFAKPSDSPDSDSPGFVIEHINKENKKLNEKEKAFQKFLTEFMLETGRRDFDGAADREDNLLDIMIKCVRDYYTIDQVCIELRRTMDGEPLDFWAVDGATIKRVIQTGFHGTINDFDPRSTMRWSATDAKGNSLQEKIEQARLALIPELRDVRFVQEIEGKLRAAYTHKDLVFDSHQKRTDLQWNGYGYPPIEQAISVIIGFMFGLAYNAEAFNTGTVPKIALSNKGQQFSQDQLAELQDQWIANFRGIYGPFRIPMLNGDWSVLNLLNSPRDYEYSDYMQFTASIALMVMGFDTAELGLRFQSAQNVMNENLDARQKFSKARGLIDILGEFEGVFNKIIKKFGWTDWKFRFVGVDPEDREQKSKLETEAVKRDTTINEIRKRKGLKADPYGDIILDPQYIQYRTQKEQAEEQKAQMEAQGGGDESGGMGLEDMDFDSMVDDEFFKASTGKRGKGTMLV